MTKPKKFTKLQKAAIERIALTGGRVLSEGDGFTDLGGNPFNWKTITSLIEAGSLASNEDAMFGARPQSYRLCQPNG